MSSLSKWLSNKFNLHLLAFLLMIIPPIPLYFAAQADGVLWIWLFLGLIICGNLLVLMPE